MVSGLPSFDLVVATVGRVAELERFLDSLESQSYPALRVVVVDQNKSDVLVDALGGRALEVLRLRSTPGLSHARNEALGRLTADIIAFPDDDCVYPPGLLERVAHRFATDLRLDGLTGRAEDAGGSSSASWKSTGATLTDDNLWNRAISFTIFLRRTVVANVGPFDERLGLGSPEPWGSGEETDYLIRAVRTGARIEYDPTLVVVHDVRPDDERTGYRDGASIGYLLRKHAYPTRVVVRMMVRPLFGVLVSLLQLDWARARFQAATFRGRVRGLRST